MGVAALGGRLGQVELAKRAQLERRQVLGSLLALPSRTCLYPFAQSSREAAERQRARTVYATVIAARWRSGTPMPGADESSAEVIASSDGSNGKSARKISIALKTPPLTVPDGTSERNATGSETMNARSERGADLARGGADRGAEGGERRAAEDDRQHDQPDPLPRDRDERRQHPQHHERHGDRGDDAERQLLDQEARLGRPSRA